MRAWAIDRYGHVDRATLRDLPRPEPKEGEVLVRVRGAAFNPADVKVATGKDGGRFLHAKRFPLVLGFDFCGVVETSRSDVWNPADEVYGFLPYSMGNTQGSFAEWLVAEAETVGRKPTSVGAPEAASAATVGLTALQALHEKGKLTHGHTVLINGASGGVGSYAVQLAKHGGAKVWGTCSARNMDYVASLGADEVVDYRETSLRSLDRRFDIVLDLASTSSFGECSSILASGGAYVTMLPSLRLVTGMLRSTFSSKRVAVMVVKPRRKDLNELADRIDAGDITVHVEKTYGMEHVNDGLQHMQRGARGKLGVSIAS